MGPPIFSYSSLGALLFSLIIFLSTLVNCVKKKKAGANPQPPPSVSTGKSSGSKENQSTNSAAKNPNEKAETTKTPDSDAKSNPEQKSTSADCTQIDSLSMKAPNKPGEGTKEAQIAGGKVAGTYDPAYDSLAGINTHELEPTELKSKKALISAKSAPMVISEKNTTNQKADQTQANSKKLKTTEPK